MFAKRADKGIVPPVITHKSWFRGCAQRLELALISVVNKSLVPGDNNSAIARNTIQGSPYRVANLLKEKLENSREN